MTRLGVWLATCGPVGYAPIAPGTAGSAVGLAVAIGFRRAALPPWLELALIAAGFVVGIWCGTRAERHFGGEDPSPVVIDEVIGMLITVALLPLTPAGALVGFLLFRVLDVVKPWPVAQLERLHGGLGIMADDAMAAIYGNLAMRALIAVAPAGWLI